MRPRKLFDIGWLDLAYGLLQCLWPREEHAVQDQWTTKHTIPCLSVRSGFDLLLQALNLPAGSEIVTTAVTIPDMLQIAREHKLVPVGVDLNLRTLQPSAEQIEKAITLRTRIILVAPLFGSQIDLRPLRDLARRHQLLLVEDGAQAFCGSGYLGSELADVNLLSFGPIKSATALGGGLIRIRDRQLLQKVTHLQEGYRRQSRFAYASRLLKYGVMKLLTGRPLFTLFLGLNHLRGRDPDQAIRSLTRNFHGRDLLDKIRQRPSRPLSAMIARRWQGYPQHRIQRRAALGRRLADKIGSVTDVVGANATEPTWWVFPIAAEDPGSVVRDLRQSGFDATTCHNLCVLKPTGDFPSEMQRLMLSCVFLPIYPEMSEEEIERISSAVIHAVPSRPATNCISR